MNSQQKTSKVTKIIFSSKVFKNSSYVIAIYSGDFQQFKRNGLQGISTIAFLTNVTLFFL